MIRNILKSITTKISVAIGVWLVGICLVAIVALGTVAKMAVEDNTEVMAELVLSVENVTKMAIEQRELSFKNGLRVLEKQSYKMEYDKADIKPADIVASSDFCASTLFKDHISSTTGSNRISIAQSCGQVDKWMLDN